MRWSGQSTESSFDNRSWLLLSMEALLTHCTVINIHIKHSFVILILVLTVVLTVEWKPLSTLQNLLYTRQQQKLTTIITKSLLITIITIWSNSIKSGLFQRPSHLKPSAPRQNPARTITTIINIIRNIISIITTFTTIPIITLYTTWSWSEPGKKQTANYHQSGKHLIISPMKLEHLTIHTKG